MSFRRNYLPRQSQSWAREVQSRIQGLEQDLTRDSINNRTRDDQLQASYNRLDLAFVDLASKQSTLEAQQIQINTALQDSTQALQDADDALQVAVTANNTAISANNTAISANNTAITANSNAIDALNDIVDLGAPGGPTINAANLTAGTITAVNIDGITITGSNFLSGGNVEVPFGTIFGDDILANDYRGRRHSNVGSTTTSSFGANVFINTSGFMFRSTATSSELAKENILPYEFDSDAFISISPITFNYKQEAVMHPEESEIKQLGFLVEDFERAGFEEFLTIPANEVDQYKGLRYDRLYMFLHKTVQEINERLKAIENG